MGFFDSITRKFNNSHRTVAENQVRELTGDKGDVELRDISIDPIVEALSDPDQRELVWNAINARMYQHQHPLRIILSFNLIVELLEALKHSIHFRFLFVKVYDHYDYITKFCNANSNAEGEFARMRDSAQRIRVILDANSLSGKGKIQEAVSPPSLPQLPPPKLHSRKPSDLSEPHLVITMVADNSDIVIPDDIQNAHKSSSHVHSVTHEEDGDLVVFAPNAKNSGMRRISGYASVHDEAEHDYV